MVTVIEKHIINLFIVISMASSFAAFAHAEEKDLIESMMDNEVADTSVISGSEDKNKAEDNPQKDEDLLADENDKSAALPPVEPTVDLVDGNTDTQSIEKDTIEITYKTSHSMVYREDRSHWSTLLAVNSEMILFSQYRSQFDRSSYDSTFGDKTLNTAQAEIGFKYNFSLGSIGLSGLYGKGFLRDLTKGGDERELAIEKMAGGANYYMDTFFSEPYFVPYVGAQLYKFNWRERSVARGEKTGATDFATMWTAGGLIQLNWLDPDAASKSRSEWGLTNMFLDIYASQYISEEEPDFTSDVNYGAGLRLEF